MIKRLLLTSICLLLTLLVSQAQPLHNNPSPTYYVDSVMVNQAYLGYLDFQNVISLNVARDNDPKYHGAVLITLKDHAAFAKHLNEKIFSLTDIAAEHIPNFNKKSKVIFIVNDKVILDTTNTALPSGMIFNVTPIPATATFYSKNIHDVTFLKIYAKPPPIYVRGKNVVE